MCGNVSQTALVLRETDGGREQDAYRDNVPMWESQVERRFILELKEHVQRKCFSDAQSGRSQFLLENKVLMSDSDVVGVQGHRPKKQSAWAALLLLANAIDCFSALHHHKEGRRGKLVSENKKKKVFVHGLLQRAPRLVECSRLRVRSKNGFGQYCN